MGLSSFNKLRRYLQKKEVGQVIANDAEVVDKEIDKVKIENTPETVEDAPGTGEGNPECDYKGMSPKKLYRLCQEQGIDCKPKKSKGYYIDLLENNKE